MSCYVDTSVLVALFTNESESARVGKWFSESSEELISAMWCVTEFASALGIKQRMEQITVDQVNQAWNRFEHLCSTDLNLFLAEPSEYYLAAKMILDRSTHLRAGDALHLACAQKHGAKNIASLDNIMLKVAKKLNLYSVL